MKESLKARFTKYEIARILGARALQIAMDAPLLYKMSKPKLEEIRYDPLRIAEIELEEDVLPITVNRPFPQKLDEGLKRERETPRKKDSEARTEAREEKEIKESGEIMEMATPEDEVLEEAEPKNTEEIA